MLFIKRNITPINNLEYFIVNIIIDCKRNSVIKFIFDYLNTIDKSLIIKKSNIIYSYYNAF